MKNDALSEHPRIGLALGGGGARGFAHIPMLEMFDFLGIQPCCISGTSIGSVMGALYASGLSGANIRALVKDHFFSKGESISALFSKKNLLRSLEFFDFEWRRGGIFRGDKIIQFLYEKMHADTFEQLRIPLHVVATDYWTGEEVLLSEGNLLSAIKASMGLPGVFTPVERDGRILIDGGGVNPVPHDVLRPYCDIVIAIDVMGRRFPSNRKIPTVFESVFSTFDIMQNSIIREKKTHCPPDYFIQPDLCNVDILHFDQAEIVYRQSQSSVEELKQILTHLRDHPSP